MWAGSIEKVRGGQLLGWLEVSLLYTDVDQELLEEAASDRCIGTEAGGAEEVRLSGPLDIEVEIVVQIERGCLEQDFSGVIEAGVPVEIDVAGSTGLPTEAKLARKASLEHPAVRGRLLKPCQEAAEGYKFAGTTHRPPTGCGAGVQPTLESSPEGSGARVTTH
jgi:hypothetical protein